MYSHLKERSADSVSMRLRERQEKNYEGDGKKLLSKSRMKKKESGFKACFFPPAL